MVLVAADVTNFGIQKPMIRKMLPVHVLDAPKAARSDGRLLRAFRKSLTSTFRAKSHRA